MSENRLGPTLSGHHKSICNEVLQQCRGWIGGFCPMMEWHGDACFTLLVCKYQFPIGMRNEFVHIASERRKVVIQKLASGKVLKILTTLSHYSLNIIHWRSCLELDIFKKKFSIPLGSVIIVSARPIVLYISICAYLVFYICLSQTESRHSN